MKSLWVCILFAAFTAMGSDLQKFHPYRVYGTNVFDFTEVIQEMTVGTHRTNSRKFMVEGTVMTVANNFSTIESVDIRFRKLTYVQDALGEVTSVPSADTIELAMYMALPQNRQMRYRSERTTSLFKVKNLRGKVGEKIQLFAYPTKGEFDYDYGEIFSGKWEDYTQYIKVTERGLVVTPIRKKSAGVSTLKK